jgi:hypothetical protein
VSTSDFDLEPDMNLYTCPRCGRTINIGTDDLAGDEDVVRLRLAHGCVFAKEGLG